MTQATAAKVAVTTVISYCHLTLAAIACIVVEVYIGRYQV